MLIWFINIVGTLTISLDFYDIVRYIATEIMIYPTVMHRGKMQPSTVPVRTGISIILLDCLIVHRDIPWDIKGLIRRGCANAYVIFEIHDEFHFIYFSYRLFFVVI